MIYKNAELHNVVKLIHNDDGSVSWMRVPQNVYDNFEIESARRLAKGFTGVEIRFVINSGSAVIKMLSEGGQGRFHVYRGGIQGGWQDHEVHTNVSDSVEEYVIEKAPNSERLKEIGRRTGSPWDSDVVRVIFDKGAYKIFDITGDIKPPTPEQCPEKTILFYGSSITHGSNSIDMSHSWVSVTAHNLRTDEINLGFAGSCAMEPEMADFIASQGEKGVWDAAVLELGINVLEWGEAKILERATDIIKQTAVRNPKKPVFIISPFYFCGDDFDESGNGDKWRRLLKRITDELNLSNVTYINGLDMIGDMSFMSADEVHPNIYGVAQIAERLTRIIKEKMGLSAL